MAGTVLIFVEQRNGALKKTSLEAVSAGYRLAKDLAGEAIALVVGTGDEALAGELGKAGAAKVLLCDAPHLATYSGYGYAKTIAAVARQVEPTAVLFAAAAMGTDLAPRVAADLDAALATDCIELLAADGAVKAIRPIYAGKALITVNAKKGPFTATLRPNVFPLEEAGRTATVEKVAAPVADGDLKDRVKEILAAAGDKIPLTEAKTIVAGGRGLKGPENFKLLEHLAAAFGAGTAVGASRSAVDEGWRPHSDQVGQTGKTVSPVLYVACGISGAIQHLAGMSSSKVIIAINKDPDAPIFKVADYGIVGDLFDVVPVLTEAVKAQTS